MAVPAGEEMDILSEGEPDMSQMDYDLEYNFRVRGKTESRPLIGINRDRLDEQVFEEEFSPVRRRSRSAAELAKMLKPPEPVLTAIKPPTNCRGWLDFFLTRLPIIGWVIGYQPSYFIGDIISGITVAIMHIPQGLAYALLANLQPVYGLYTSFTPVIIYSIFGTSRHLSIGTFAVVELMIGNAIDKSLDTIGRGDCHSKDDDGAVVNRTSMDSLGFNVTGLEECESLKVEMAITLAFLTGIIMLVMGIFRLGFITIFLSEPLISGYTTGAACHVFTSQLRHITGVSTPRVPGLWSVPLTWINTFKMIQDFNPAPIIIAALSAAVLIVFKICNKLLQKPKVKVPFPVYERRARTCTTKKIKWPIPIPSQLIVVVVATFVSYIAMLETRFDVIVVGHIPKGLPNFTIPNVDYVLPLLQDAFVISIVTFAVTVSLAKVFARQFSYSIDSNQEFMAYGIMNIVGCFFSSFTAAGSLSRSSIQANAGGKTQLVGFISSLSLLVILLALGPLFEQLPRAVLAAVIWVALYGMFSQLRDIWKYYKLSIWDMLVWIVVFLATVLLGVDLGLGVGVGFSLMVIVIRTILPHSSTLGKAEDTEIFRNMDHFEKVKAVPGIVIFRFQAPLCFINSGVFRARLEIACNIYKSKLGKEEPNGCIKELFLMALNKTGAYKVSSEESDIKASYSSSNQAVAFSRSESFQQAVANDIVSVSSLPAGNNSTSTAVKTVIIDCAPIGFMDAVGVKSLQQIVMDFDKVGIQVLFVAMTKENRDLLARSGFFQKCSKRWLFPSMQDAVDHAKHGLPLRPSQMNLNEANGHVSGGLNALSNVEGGLQTIQEDQEDDDSQPIEVTVVEVSGGVSSGGSADVDISGSHESTHSNKKDS